MVQRQSPVLGGRLVLVYAVACVELFCGSSEKARALCNRIVRVLGDARPKPSFCWVTNMPPRDKRNLALISLLLVGNLDGFGPASKPAENPDFAPGDAEMLCEQFDDCLVGPALPGWLLDPDYIAITFLTDLFSSGIGLHLNLNLHFITIISRIVMSRNRERDSDCRVLLMLLLLRTLALSC